MLLRKLRALSRNAEGNVALVFALTLLPVVALGGAGIDVARYESIRVELQDRLDRGVLAAASLTQQKAVDVTIRDYLKTLSYADDVQLTEKREIGINARKIHALASYTIDTSFMHLLGIKTLTISAASMAQEAKQNVEMSLMLDMSGSMIANNRFRNLKKAAKEFVDQVLTDSSKTYTTISMVPYAGHVNVGAAVFDKLGGARIQSDSSCFELGETNAAYGADPISFKNAAQLPHFTNWNFGRTDLKPWWCPVETTAITYVSNDAALLKQRIDALEMHDGTGTQNAMQWGYTLLNPAGKTVTEAAISVGAMDSKFASRPSAFNDPDTMKIIVLMTDGAISEQYRPKDYSRPSTQKPDNKMVSSAATDVTRLANVCTAAKKNGIIIFTIGFEVSGDAVNQMKSCASSAGHFYPTSGAGISDTFKSISASIKLLRLTQ